MRRPPRTPTHSFPPSLHPSPHPHPSEVHVGDCLTSQHGSHSLETRHPFINDYLRIMSPESEALSSSKRHCRCYSNDLRFEQVVAVVMCSSALFYRCLAVKTLQRAQIAGMSLWHMSASRTSFSSLSYESARARNRHRSPTEGKSE